MKLRNFKGLLFLVIVFTFFYTLWLAEKVISQRKEYPEKQIDIIIGFSPGGPIDVGTRILVEELKKELNVPTMIVYKPGATGAVAISHVIHAKPDGYTLLSSFSASLVNLPAMEKNPTFDPVNSFTPICSCTDSPTVLTTYSSSKLTSFDVTVKFARQNPGKLNCATIGIASNTHFLLEYLKKHGVDITHVPNKGAAPAVTSLLGKHVDLAGTAYPPVAPHIKSGQLRPLVVTSKLKQSPETPTMAEFGFPEAPFFGSRLQFFAPLNLPKPILDRLSSAFDKVIQLPSVVQSLENAGFIPSYMGPDALKKQIMEEYIIIKEITKSAGLVK